MCLRRRVKAHARAFGGDIVDCDVFGSMTGLSKSFVSESAATNLILQMTTTPLFDLFREIYLYIAAVLIPVYFSNYIIFSFYGIEVKNWLILFR